MRLCAVAKAPLSPSMRKCAFCPARRARPLFASSLRELRAVQMAVFTSQAPIGILAALLAVAFFGRRLASLVARFRRNVAIIQCDTLRLTTKRELI